MLALRNEILELVYIRLLAEIELAAGCVADSTHGLTKPEHWFEKVMTLPSQTE